MALVDCVQDTYSNVAALIDDSVYNLEGGLEDDLEKSLIDLTRVDPRVTTIVAGVRSLSMTFKVKQGRVKLLYVMASPLILSSEIVSAWFTHVLTEKFLPKRAVLLATHEAGWLSFLDLLLVFSQAKAWF